MSSLFFMLAHLNFVQPLNPPDADNFIPFGKEWMLAVDPTIETDPDKGGIECRELVTRSTRLLKTDIRIGGVEIVLQQSLSARHSYSSVL